VYGCVPTFAGPQSSVNGGQEQGIVRGGCLLGCRQEQPDFFSHERLDLLMKHRGLLIEFSETACRIYRDEAVHSGVIQDGGQFGEDDTD